MRTIVGGRPRKGEGPGGRAARGIDVLLLKGAVDPEFRELLGRDWFVAATEIGLDLTESEQVVLASVPGGVLISMAARMHVPKSHRAVFRGKTASAMLVIVAGLGIAGCARPAPPAVPEVNEPAPWSPPVFIAGMPSEPPLEEFEYRTRGPEPGDEDPSTVNEPQIWNPPIPFFGIAPEWNERTHDYESEDENQ